MLPPAFILAITMPKWMQSIESVIGVPLYGLIIFSLSTASLCFPCYVIYRTVLAVRREKALRRRLIVEEPCFARASELFPVEYATPAYLGTLFKLLGWEGAGILAVVDDGVVFAGADGRGQPIRREFSRDGAQVTWHGRLGRGSMLPWFAITCGEEALYFAVSEGTSWVGVMPVTREAYNRIAQVLPATEERVHPRGILALAAMVGMLVLGAVIVLASLVFLALHQLGLAP